MATLTVEVDDDVKAEADRLYRSMGMDLTTAVNVFLRESIQAGGMPFAPTANVRGVRVSPTTVLYPARGESGIPILPADWDDEEDSIYDGSYQ